MTKMLAEAQYSARAAGASGAGGLSEAELHAGVALPAAARRVGATRLVLTDFRNYREARLALDTAPVVLSGANGAGKTNLLEALSLFAPGRGLRRARLSDLDRRGPDGAATGRGWAVAATFDTPRGTLRLGTGRDPGGSERRQVRIDGEPAKSQAALGERLGILWLTPAMDRIFLEGPGGRRRFLDRLVLGLDPAHGGRVAAYEEAMRERSRLLRDGPADAAWLAALEEVMAKEGVAAAAGRRETADRLDRACAAAQGPFPRARLSLLGAIEEGLAARPALAVEEEFAAALRQSRAADAALGGATIGPHRTDLAVTYAEKGIAAASASTGEQKALLVAILLAQAGLQREIRGEAPLLLLDEVAAHLDESRREALFAALLGLEGQVWLSGTDAALFAPLRRAAQFVAVRDGTLGSDCL
jgi:DNA replication and repair protein RecF